jgi:hypothetical protein
MCKAGLIPKPTSTVQKYFIINTSQKTLQEVINMIQNQVLTSLVEPR